MTALEILNLYYQRKKRGGYSLRALARDLSVSPAFVSNVFKGKKKLPRTLFSELSKRLDIDDMAASDLQKQLYTEIQHENPSPGASPSSLGWKLADRSSFSALRQWYYVAILELVTCRTFEGSKESLSRKLGVSIQSVDIALRELQSLNLLVQKNGRIEKTNEKIRLSSSKSLQEIRHFHRQMLDKANKELELTSDEAFEKRLITGIMISAEPAKIKLAKKMLSEALHEIADFLTAEAGSEVYHLAAQLFPITKP